MKTRFPLLIVLLIACASCGCNSYSYVFETVISENGRVQRTVNFSSASQSAEEVTEELAEEPADAADEAVNNDDGHATEALAAETVNPGLPISLVIPDRARFDDFELTENEFTGTWCSDGEIFSDFRDMTPSYNSGGEPSGRPITPWFLREAYNQGQVTVSDLVLVKTIDYTETFHDYYLPEEFDEHGDVVVNILAALFLDVLHEDFGEEYDFRAFDELINGTLVPFAKKWKRVYCKWAIEEWQDDAARITLRSVLMPPEELRFVYDLYRLGVTDDLRFEPVDLHECLVEWGVERMHELVKHREDGTPLPKDLIGAYFAQGEVDPPWGSPFAESATRLAAKRYGEVLGGECFGSHLFNLYNSFAFTSDYHDFDVTVWFPGTVIRAFPAFASVEPQADGGAVVGWEFDQDDFFPDSVHLSAVCALPISRTQERLFGKVVLEDAQEMARYVALLNLLSDEVREAFLRTLRGCIQDGSLEGLSGFAEEHVPEEASDRTRHEWHIESLVQLMRELKESGEEE